MYQSRIRGSDQAIGIWGGFMKARDRIAVDAGRMDVFRKKLELLNVNGISKSHKNANFTSRLVYLPSIKCRFLAAAICISSSPYLHIHIFLLLQLPQPLRRPRKRTFYISPFLFLSSSSSSSLFPSSFFFSSS